MLAKDFISENALGQATDTLKRFHFGKFDKLANKKTIVSFLFIGKKYMREDYIECNHFVNYQIHESCSGKLQNPCPLK